MALKVAYMQYFSFFYFSCWPKDSLVGKFFFVFIGWAKKKKTDVCFFAREYIDVYSVAVDLQQNKVTVTGNVDADVLIKRLLKHGKHAELLPKVPAKNDVKNQQPPLMQQPTRHEKKSDGSLAKEVGTSSFPNSPPPKKKQPDEEEAAPSQTKNSLEANANGNDGTTAKKASTQPENPSAGPSNVKSGAAASVAGDTSRGIKETAESAAAGDDSGKNKNKEVPFKGVPYRARGDEAPKAAKQAGGDGGAVVSPASSNYYPAHPQAHQPIYTMSHRTAQPSSSYPVNYAPPVPCTYAHGYAHLEGTASPPPGNFSSAGTSAFDLFSDENANSCSLMW